jgi:hypothetical protein
MGFITISNQKMALHLTPRVLLSSLTKIFYIRLILDVLPITRGCDLKPAPALKNTQCGFG